MKIILYKVNCCHILICTVNLFSCTCTFSFNTMKKHNSFNCCTIRRLINHRFTNNCLLFRNIFDCVLCTTVSGLDVDCFFIVKERYSSPPPLFLISLQQRQNSHCNKPQWDLGWMGKQMYIFLIYKLYASSS